MQVVERWQRRRLQRAITRLTERMERVRGEIDLLSAQAGSLSDDADHAATDAVLRSAGPVQREASRATAAHDNHQRLLAEHRAELDDLRQRRDHLLDRL